MIETVTISKSEYARLIDVDNFMDALESAGVDNWEGYGYACSIYNGEEEDEDY